jgi:hypothetical protein
LDKLSALAENDPGFLSYLQARNELVPITLALMLSRRKQQRSKPSEEEIVSLVNRVAEDTSTSQAYRRVARWLHMTEDAVKQRLMRWNRKTR